MLQNLFHLFLIQYEHIDTTLFNTNLLYITHAYENGKVINFLFLIAGVQ